MSKRNALPLRSEIPEEYTWDLTHIFPSDQAWYDALEEVKALTQGLTRYQGHLSEGPEQLLGLLQLEDQLSAAYRRLSSYAGQKRNQDTTVGIYQTMNAQMRAQYVAWGAIGAFEIPELLALPEGTIDRYLDEVPALQPYRLSLKRVLNKRSHTLSDHEEVLLARTGEMRDTPSEIYSALSNADLTFPDALDSRGQPHMISHGSFVPLLKSEDRTLRRSAFEGLYSVYGRFQNTIAAILAAQLRQLQFYANARSYPSLQSAALERNEVPVQVYDNLIDTVHANLDKFYRYTELRRRLLGVDQLHMYDMYAPMVRDLSWSFTFEEAKELCLLAVRPLGEDYVALMQEGFDNRWIDVFECKGKRSGAYSSGSDPHPYVLLNFQGTLSDVFTLIHEMGHSIHSYLSRRHQPVTYASYVIFVAEVASTCNEALLMQYLLDTTEDPKKRAYLLSYYLEQFRGTLYRQTMFAEFEREIGHLAESGKGLTAESFNEIYGRLNQLYFGPHVISDPEISLEWARIPHFYMNYYVYQYATGYSAATALSERILREGEPAVRDYLRFLSGGSSADPITLLQGAGVDMTTPDPINRALALFGQLIDHLDVLMQEL